MIKTYKNKLNIVTKEVLPLNNECLYFESKNIYSISYTPYNKNLMAYFKVTYFWYKS